MTKLARLSAVCVLLLLTGCGYQWGRGSSVEDYCTVCVPYVEGDHNGWLTSELVREVVRGGSLKYVHTGGDLVLSVCISDLREENIGFRYDRDKDGNVQGNVIPTETRLTVLAEVTVTERCTGCEVVGPDLISATVDFDHDYYTNQGGVNVFSLGQLNDLDLAQEVAYQPLYRELAHRIADHVNNSW